MPIIATNFKQKFYEKGTNKRKKKTKYKIKHNSSMYNSEINKPQSVTIS